MGDMASTELVLYRSEQWYEELESMIRLDQRQLAYERFDIIALERFRQPLHLFQLQLLYSILRGVDSIGIKGTGAGKSRVFGMIPMIRRRSVTIVVVPLKSIMADQKLHLSSSGVRSCVLNEDTIKGMAAWEWKLLQDGGYNLIFISPESALDLKQVQTLFQLPSFRALVAFLVADEAHCITTAGGEFRKAYGRLGTLRKRLPPVVVLALTATGPRNVVRGITVVLDIRPGFFLLHESNDRPDIFEEIRVMDHPANTFKDLFSLLPPAGSITCLSQIPLTVIFVDNTKTTEAITFALETEVRRRYPTLFFNRGSVITYYHAVMSQEYLVQTVVSVRLDVGIRILVATEAAGMGLDIQGIQIVVQWTFSIESVIVWKQRVGRMRGRGRAIFLISSVVLKKAPGKLRELEEQLGSVQRLMWNGEGAERVGEGEGGEVMAGDGEGEGWLMGVEEDDAEPVFTVSGVTKGGRKTRNLHQNMLLLRMITEKTCVRQFFDAYFNNPPSSVPPMHCCYLCERRRLLEVPNTPLSLLAGRAVKLPPPLKAPRAKNSFARTLEERNFLTRTMYQFAGTVQLDAHGIDPSVSSTNILSTFIINRLLSRRMSKTDQSITREDLDRWVSKSSGRWCFFEDLGNPLVEFVRQALEKHPLPPQAQQTVYVKLAVIKKKTKSTTAPRPLPSTSAFPLSPPPPPAVSTPLVRSSPHFPPPPLPPRPQHAPPSPAPPSASRTPETGSSPKRMRTRAAARSSLESGERG